jgi:colanic acid/amylovoran biosynthesis protein
MNPTTTPRMTAMPLDGAAAMTPPRQLRFGLMGAAPGTGNLGVDALYESVVQSLIRRFDRPSLTTFDNGRGLRPTPPDDVDRGVEETRCGAICTRRIWTRDSLWRIYASGRLGGLGHPAIEKVRDLDAVLDVTGGDSFTDMYSRRRFRIVSTEKRIVLDQGRPLILLPQTIGPFNQAASRRRATEILRSCAMIWARDEMSFAVVRDMLGPAFDPARHRCGVDLAFALEAGPPADLPDAIAEWMEADRERPLVAMNVSGLLMNSEAAARRYGLIADYQAIVTRLAAKLLDEAEANIIFVPHVLTQTGHFEHDPDAAQRVVELLGDRAKGRTALLPEGLSATETKWVISQADWACATRMHAGIAALSTGTATGAIAYSRKTAGVYATCGLEHCVADPRTVRTEDAIDVLWRAWRRRIEIADQLADVAPRVRAQARAQMDEVLSQVAGRDAVTDAALLRKAA